LVPRWRWPQRRQLGLNIKLSVVVITIALLDILVSSTLPFGFLEQQAVQHAEAMVAHLTTPLRASLRHANLNGDAAMVNSIVTDVAGELGDKKIWVLNQDGDVRASSMADEIGQPDDCAGRRTRYQEVVTHADGYRCKPPD
jgi:hypothetical protein